MSTIYISGPMTGYPEFNIPAFDKAEAELRAAGFEVINPAHVLPHDPKHAWHDYLREDLRVLLDADGVALLNGWEQSRGSKLEVHVADQLKITVKHLDVWLNQGARVL